MTTHGDRCVTCGGELRPGTTTLELWRDGELIVIRDVPADVCGQCKESYIAASTSADIDLLLARKGEPDRYLSVPEYSASHLAAA